MGKKSKKKVKEVLPSPVSMREYLLRLFRGKAGWKYVSVSLPGSTFPDEYRNIVPIHLHKEPPIVLDDGKYKSENRIFVECIALKAEHSDFQGVVLDRLGNGYTANDISQVGALGEELQPPPPVRFLELPPEAVFDTVTPELIDKASAAAICHLTTVMNAAATNLTKLDKFFKNSKGEPVSDKSEEEFLKLLPEISDDDSPETIGIKLNQLKDMSKVFSSTTSTMLSEMKKLKEAIDSEDAESQDDTPSEQPPVATS